MLYKVCSMRAMVNPGFRIETPPVEQKVFRYEIVAKVVLRTSVLFLNLFLIVFVCFDI